MNAEALIGTVLGTCTLQKLIGQGGMGAVYLAQQSRPRRQVAVKVLLPITPLTPDQQTAFLERFRRETDVVASLEHPNIMPVHEYGERNGLAYLVMPYVDGGTLREEMEREGQLPLDKAVFYLEQLVAALEFAHESGVIHRDIKPANILLRREGRLLLTDFGLVKIVTEGQNANSRLTGVGVPLGTPDYMAPEQAMGGEIDARADLYSLGVILYQMVTGTVPFKGDLPMQVAMQHTYMPPAPPRSLRPDLPAAAEQVLLRALAKRPDDRYLRVQDFASAFRLALTVSGVPLPDFSSLLAPGALTNARLFTPNSLLTSARQGSSPVGSNTHDDSSLVPGLVSALPQAHADMPRNDIVGKTSMPMPSLAAFLPQDTPLPATVATPPAAGGGNARSGPRSILGHKLSLRRPSDEAAVRPLTPPPATGPEEMQSAFVPFEGSGLRPSPFLPPVGASPRPVSSLSAEVPGARPVLGRSNLRPLTPTSASGSAMPSVSSMPGEGQSAQSQVAPSVANTDVRPLVPLNGYTQAPPSAPSISGTLSSGAGMSGIGQANSASSAAPPMPGNPIPQPYGVPLTQQSGATATQAFGGSVTQQLGPSTTRQLTGALVMGNMGMSESGNTNMMKLSQAAKVIQVPVAGQPGRYVTGLLPVLEEPKPALPPHIASRVETLNVMLKGRLKLVVLVAAIALILFSSLAFWLVQSHGSRRALNSGNMAGASADTIATATANAIATANANVIVTDSLNGASGNVHNWPLAQSGAQLYSFKNGAYHITANDPHPAIALLSNVVLPGSFVYSLTMHEVKGDEGSVNNRFGMILRFNRVTKNGKMHATFYCFEVSNTHGGEYQFLKYDDSAPTTWTELWPASQKTVHFGKEYHFGHGANAKNTFQVVETGNKFTFIVNGKRVGNAHDNSLKDGQAGMFVNLQGTEVAFSNLALTYN
jgi:eukaryotic-like serine/threonine-protein kinase